MRSGKNILLLTSVLLLASSTASALWHQKGKPAHQPTCPPTTNNASVYTQGPTVTTSPYLGIRSAYDGGDLIVNLSSMNEDLRLLRQRKKLKDTLGIDPAANRPLVEISGDVAGEGTYYSTFKCHSGTDIDLTSARLDAFSEVSEWASGYISIDYDSSPLPSAIPGSGYRLKNSKLLLKRGFLTIGNLSYSPVYFSLGQMFAPFGRYSTATVTAPLTAAIGKTNTRTAVLGVCQNGLFGQAYAFRGDAKVGDNGVNQWGLNLGYDYVFGAVKGEVGAGYISNIADATGIQAPSTECGFKGFGYKSSYEELHCRVPAYDLHGSIGYGPAKFTAEYINTTRAFDKDDLSYNNSGARLSALHVELHGQTCLYDHPLGGSLAYGHSCDALGLGQPQQSFFVALSTVLWKNTLQSLEYRHDCNYCSGDTASGRGEHYKDDEHPEDDVLISKGGSRNSVVAHIGVYF